MSNMSYCRFENTPERPGRLPRAAGPAALAALRSRRASPTAGWSSSAAPSTCGARSAGSSARRRRTARWRPFYAAQENAEELLAKWDGDAEALGTIVSDAAEAVREVISEYEDVANEHPNLASANEERVSELESIADDLEGFEVEEFDADAGKTKDDWKEEQRDEAAAVISRMSEV